VTVTRQVPLHRPRQQPGQLRAVVRVGLDRGGVHRAFPRLRPAAPVGGRHHVIHWSDGGETTLTNAVLLCRYHHRVIHHGEWQIRIAADGLPEFLPPAWLDPAQRPRRNHYHPRC
jgi:hypothetical protein